MLIHTAEVPQSLQKRLKATVEIHLENSKLGQNGILKFSAIF